MPNIYQQIEARFGFHLPQLWMEMTEQGLFDSTKGGDVGLGKVYTPEQIRDFKFYDLNKPGLVPFGEDSINSALCWQLDEANEERIPVALCYLDCGFAWYYAPDFLSSLYRIALENNSWPDEVVTNPLYNRAEKELRARSSLRRWASVFEPYFPPHWTQTLRDLSERKALTWGEKDSKEHGLVDENECREIVTRDLAYEKLDEEFCCDTDQVDLPSG